MINSKVIIRILGSVILTLYLMGCSAQNTESQHSESTTSSVKNNEEESGLVQDEEEVTTIRWGVIGQYNCADPDKKEFVDRKRNSAINAALKEKGLAFEVKVVFIDQEVGDQLETAISYSEPFDIVTFEAAGIGADDMQENLLPLEDYMVEDGILYEVYQIYSEQIWQANQIDGHNYSLGQLIGAVSPVYCFENDASLISELNVDAELLIQGTEEEIEKYIKENNGSIMAPAPYYDGSDDEVFAEYQFFMIAPGVGININNGTQFENIWKSEYMAEYLEQELQRIRNGVNYSYVGMKDADWYAYRYVDQLNGSYMIESKFVKDGYIMHYPDLSKTHMVPLMEQCYTSILKDSEHVEECLTLMAELNTDKELFETLYVEPGRGQGENPTGEFAYICNYYIATEEPNGAQIQNERVAALTETQISPVLGFAFDRTPVEKEVQALEIAHQREKEERGSRWFDPLTEVRNDAEQYPIVFEQVWTEMFNEYLQKLQDAGIDKVIEEANRQLEQWRAENPS